jgi:5-methylcytosine-specific restriction enzyme A
MPTKPLKPCAVPGCPEMVQGDRCAVHRSGREKRQGPRIRGAHERLYTSSTWKRVRLRVLREEPTCRACGAASTQVDHIIPFRPEVGGSRYDRANLQALCERCHGEKSAADRRNLARMHRRPA